GDQVLVVDAPRRLDDLRPPIITELIAQLHEIGANHGQEIPFTAQKLFVAEDLLAQAVVLLDDFIALQSGELTELHADHRLGLGFGQMVALVDADLALEGGEMLVPQGSAQNGSGYGEVLQTILSLGSARRLTASRNHLIQRRDRDELPLKDMGPPFGLTQQEFGTPADEIGRAH